MHINRLLKQALEDGYFVTYHMSCQNFILALFNAHHYKNYRNLT